MDDTIKDIISYIINVAIIFLVTLSVVSFMLQGGTGNMQVTSYNCFKYFTIDSNILAMLCSLLYLPFLIVKMAKNKPIPQFVMILKYIGTVAIMVTFLTVILFLGPTQGYPLMFEGYSLFLHLICPVLAFITFLFFEESKPLPFYVTFLGVSSVALYGTIYFIQVIITKLWQDFYGFNGNDLWFVSVIAMLIATYILSFTTRLLFNKINKKTLL